MSGLSHVIFIEIGISYPPLLSCEFVPFLIVASVVVVVVVVVFVVVVVVIVVVHWTSCYVSEDFCNLYIFFAVCVKLLYVCFDLSTPDSV